MWQMAAAKSDEIKAQVIAALLAGQGIRETARQFHLSTSTVHALRQQAGIAAANSVRTEKRDEFGDAILNVYRAGTIALDATAKIALDQDWLRKQSAAELATFFGVIFDKCGRILESLRFDDDSDAGQT